VADVLTAPDGSLYIVGTATIDGGKRITLVHLKENGQLDTNFGTDGKYMAPIGSGNTQAMAATFNANGDILVAGARTISGANTDFTVCKFHGASSVIFSATLTPCLIVPFNLGGNSHDVARAVTVLSDGRIALAGWANAAPGFDEAAVAVLDPDGTPDAGFGTNGKQYFLHAMTRQDLLYSIVENGSTLAMAGEAVSSDNYHAALFASVDKNTGAAIGYTANFLGSPSGPAAYRDLILLRNGTLAAVGTTYTINNESQGVATHVASQGDLLLDGFGGPDGLAMLDSGDNVELTRAIEQRDGKLLVAGTRQPTNSNSTQLIVGRFDGSGNLDVVGFHPIGGYNSVDFQLPGSYDNGAVLTLQGTRPVVAGSVEATSNADNNYDFGVARLQSDEIFGSGFGKGYEE
jgi:uncharacterized delta-60 repeat protein